MDRQLGSCCQKAHCPAWQQPIFLREKSTYVLISFKSGLTEQKAASHWSWGELPWWRIAWWYWATQQWCHSEAQRPASWGRNWASQNQDITHSQGPVAHSWQFPFTWCLKFSKTGFSNTWTVNFQMFNPVLEKAEEPEIKLPTSAGSWKKQKSSRKTSTSALLTMPKPLTVWITINCGKFWKRWEYQATWPASWETCMQVRKQLLELDMEQQTGSK